MRVVGERVTTAVAYRVGFVAMPAAACARASAASAAATVAARALSARAARYDQPYNPGAAAVHDHSQHVPEPVLTHARERAASDFFKALSSDTQSALLRDAVTGVKNIADIGVIVRGYMPHIEANLSPEQQERLLRIRTLLVQRQDGFGEKDFKQFFQFMNDVFLTMNPPTRWSNVSYSAHFRYLEEKHPNVERRMAKAVISDVNAELFEKLEPVKAMLSTVYGETAKTYLANLSFFEVQFRAGTLDEKDFQLFLKSIRDALRPRTEETLYD